MQILPPKGAAHRSTVLTKKAAWSLKAKNYHFTTQLVKEHMKSYEKKIGQKPCLRVR